MGDVLLQTRKQRPERASDLLEVTQQVTASLDGAHVSGSSELSTCLSYARHGAGHLRTGGDRSPEPETKEQQLIP